MAGVKSGDRRRHSSHVKAIINGRNIGDGDGPGRKPLIVLRSALSTMLCSACLSAFFVRVLT